MRLGLSKTRAEVKELEKLRQLFLDAPKTEGLDDYWQDTELLQLYDITYARRIGWKWSAVVGELAQRGWAPDHKIERWIDWGCGSGIATEIFAQTYATRNPNPVLLSDRSQRARQFAQNKIKSQFPELTVHECPPEELTFKKTDLILISHVLTELNDSQLQRLTAQISTAGTIVWVEPGTPFCSRRLVGIRKELAADFSVISPCPHQSVCGLENSEKDWCHMFAQPPQDIFHDSDWSRFAKELNIDLRSLPTSFLVLERKDSIEANSASGQRKRLIGRPRFYKGQAKLILCDESGVRETSLQERWHKSDFKKWQRDSFCVELTNAQDSD